MSAPLAAGDGERLLRFVADAESYDGDQPVTPELLTELGTLVRADWIGYSELDWERRCGVFTADRPGNEFEPVSDEDLESRFWSEFAAIHPIRQAALRGYVGALRVSDFGGWRALRRTHFYNEWMRPYPCEHALDLTVRSKPNRTHTFHFDRAAGRDFTERDRAILDALEPHLARLAATAQLRRRLAAALEELERARAPLIVESQELTPREQEVLAWVARGKTNAEVAQILWLAPSTVRKHLENVYVKLGVSTRTAAVARVFGTTDAQAP